MMYRGRYQLGDIVPLTVVTGVTPDRAPGARIYGPAGLVLGLRMPIFDKQAQTGFFQYRQPLDSRFAAGDYSVVYDWQIGGVNFRDSQEFEIVPGGDADGAGVSAYYYTQAGADQVLVQTTAGRIIRRRNPRI